MLDTYLYFYILTTSALPEIFSAVRKVKNYE